MTERSRETNRIISSESYYQYKTMGICWRCKTRWVEPGRTYCEVCKRIVKAEAERRDPGAVKRNAYSRERRARLHAAGLCETCGKYPAQEGKRQCASCAQKKAERCRMRRLRQRVLEGRA